MNQPTNANRLDFAILIKYFQQEARSPNDKHDVPTVVVQYVANQIDADADFFTYGWGGQGAEIHSSSKRNT
ncbi:DUF4158 domain-containing protein [Bacillus wiedmannii]|uniref:DUF4158 domain-containing protein n=1 Tax=Bacillus wiedmannii TaxID=1890302 RepID=UPI001F4F6AD2|nr:DUF4158 domain-containing protein [Bacillus wiedmannii]